MSGIIPTVGKTEVLSKFLNQALTLRLYSNNITPGASDTYATYTEVAGGGYAAISLHFADCTIVGNLATYLQVEFDFTGITTAPGVIYGYYILNAANVLVGAERFGASVLPFTPANGSTIKIIPRIQD